MREIENIRKINPTLAQTIEKQYGFITDDQIAQLTNINRLMLVLVRCGNGRFLAPVQDVNHFVNIIEEHAKLKTEQTGNELAGDYIRDVSLPA